MRLIYRYFIVVLITSGKEMASASCTPLSVFLRMLFQCFTVITSGKDMASALCTPLSVLLFMRFQCPIKVPVDGNATIHLRPHARHVAGVLSHRPARPAPTSLLTFVPQTRRMLPRCSKSKVRMSAEGNILKTGLLLSPAHIRTP